MSFSFNHQLPDRQPARITCLYTITCLIINKAINLVVLQGVMIKTISKNAVKMLVKSPNYLEYTFSHFCVL